MSHVGSASVTKTEILTFLFVNLHQNKTHFVVFTNEKNTCTPVSGKTVQCTGNRKLRHGVIGSLVKSLNSG